MLQYNDKTRNKTLLFTIILLLFIGLGTRIYLAQGKDSLFLDENLSVILSNYTSYGWSENLADSKNGAYTGKEIKELIFGDVNTIDNILMDVWSLRKATRDVHSNLYYSLLRVSFWNSDTADLSQVVRRGVGLNLLLFVLSFVFLVKTLRLFTKSILPIASILIVAFLNPLSVGNTLFIRAYQLQETLFVIATYLFFTFYFYLKTYVDEKRLKRKLFFGAVATLVSSLVVLTGYFSIPFVFLLWVVSLFCIIKYKRYNYIILFCSGAVLALALIYLIYPTALYSIFGNKDNVSIDIFSDLFKEKVLNIWGVIFSNYLGGAAFILILLLLVVSIYKRREFRVYFPLFIISSITLVWIIFVWFISPFNTPRYVVAGLPILSIVLLPFLENVTNSKLREVFVVAISIAIIFNLYTNYKNKNLYWEKVDIEHYAKDETIPLILYRVYSPWGQTAMVPFMTDNRIVEITYDRELLLSKIYEYDEMYVVMYEGEEYLKDIPASDFYIEYEPLFEGSIWFDGYKVEKINK